MVHTGHHEEAIETVGVAHLLLYRLIVFNAAVRRDRGISSRTGKAQGLQRSAVHSSGVEYIGTG